MNPAGVYRRSFTVGRRWKRQQVVLHVGGAESVHAVYLNDRFVGYGTDSRLPSEYDITDHLVPGEPRGDRGGAVQRRAMSRTRTSGGWPACTAACSSKPDRRCTWPTSPSTPTCAWRTAPAC
ncbi:MAG: hypothetical protein R2713_10705 [Ilumatobacteraceae bacterium]